MSGEALRRGLHASTALVLLAIPIGSWSWFRLLVVACTAVTLLVEALRLSLPAVRGRLATLLPVFRPAEARGPSGAMWLWLGYAAAAWLPPPAPAAGILVAALADPAAAVVGARVGRGRRKSWPGTAAALAVGSGALAALGIGWAGIVVGAVVGAALERWSAGLDDNLVMAPGVALAVLALA